MAHTYCVIMAGGIGARFWPMSRDSRPKQFIDILGTGKTLIQQAYDRVKRFCPQENIFIVTNEAYKKLVKEQISGIKESQILGEPLRRNTAPCIAYACYKIRKFDPEAIIVVASSDHLIKNEEEFVDTIKIALKLAKSNDWLITLGIKPTRPDMGYGYIQFVEKKVSHISERIYKVKTFTEKPDYELAKKFLKSGDFLWNSGIFIWNVNTIINAFENYLPEIHTIFFEGIEFLNTPKEKDFITKVYPTCKNISIDYGVMEKAENVYVITSDFGWSDIGTWGSVFDNLIKDKNNNAIIGNHVMTYNSKNCIINMPKDKLVVLQGLSDFIVVESDNILLICRKSDEQQIREIVNNVLIEKGERYV